MTGGTDTTRIVRRRAARARLALALTLALVLAGCRQELYRDLNESDANTMVATLLAAGISAQKQAVGESFTVTVDEADMLRSISILKERGLPPQPRVDIGTVFQKSGIMSSPFEERVRYIYALGEEVAQTLSHIDGVVTARVHIVLPEEPKLGQPVRPSSAAVFIKHQPGVDLDFFVPQIRRLVSSAIEGLDYASVTVVLSEAKLIEDEVARAADPVTEAVLPGLSVLATDVGAFRAYAYGALALILLLVGALGGLGFLLWRRAGGGRAGGALPAAQMEPS